MSDITDVLTQQDVADSILGDDNVVGSWSHGALAESAEAPSEAAEPQENSNAEALANLETDRESWRPQNAEPDPFVAQEAARRTAESREQPQQQEAPTPAAIQESITQLDSFVRENSLNDPATAKDFATDFCAAFGSDPYKSGVNVEGLGSVMAKTAFSALNAYQACNGDISQLGRIPAESARAFTSEFLRAWGVDPRATQVNEQMLAETVFRGAANFVHTYQQFGGKVSNLDQLNTPEAATWFLSNFLQAFGAPPDIQVDRAIALKLADSAGKYMLGMITKLSQMQPQPQQRGRRANSAPRQASGRRWKTNQDLFGGAEEVLANEKTPRNDQGQFAPKQRPASSPFKSNTDLFDAHTMDLYHREHGRL